MTSKTDAPPPTKGRKWLRRLAWASGILLGLVLVAWFAAEVWLIPKAVKAAQRELSKAGIHIGYDDVDIRPLRGSLVVQNLTLYREYERKTPVVFISDFGVKIDVGALVRGKPLWGEGSVQDGKIIVYGDEQNTVFESFQAEIEIESHELRITRASSDSLGYDVTSTGLVRWARPPGTPAPEPASSGNTAAEKTEEPRVAQEAARPEFPDFPGQFGWLHSLEEIFACEPLGDERPGLGLDVRWDMTLPPEQHDDGSTIPFSQLSIDGSVNGRDLRWLGLPLDSIDGTFQLENWEVKIPSATFVGIGGELTTSGVYDIAPMRLTMRDPVSDMHPIDLCKYLGLPFAEELKEIDFTKTPLIRGDGITIDFSEPKNTQLALTLDAPAGLRYQARDEVLEAERFRCDIVLEEPGEFRVENIDSHAGGLDIEGSVTLNWRPVLVDPGASPPAKGDRPEGPPAGGDARPDAGDGAAQSPPTPSPPARKTVAAMIKQWFLFKPGAGGAPKLRVDAVIDSEKPIYVTGRFTGEEFGWQERDIDSLDLDFKIENDVLHCSDVMFTGLSGHIEGSGSFDLVERIVRIPALDSTVNLTYLKEQFKLELPPLVDSIEFPSAPHLTAADLLIDLDDPSEGSGSLQLIASEGFSMSDGKESLTTNRFDVAVAWPERDLMIVERASVAIGGLELETSGEFRWQRTQPATQPDAAPVDPIAAATAKEDAELDLPLKLKDEDGEEHLSPLGVVRDLLTVKADGDPARVSGTFEWDEKRRQEDIADGVPAGIAGLNIEAELDSKSVRWRRLPIRRGAANIRLDSGVFAFSEMQLQTDTGELKADAELVMPATQLRIDDLTLTLDPVQTMRQLGLETTREKSWHARFPRPPVISGRRLLLDLEDINKSAGDLDLTFPGGIIVVTDRGREVTLDSVRGAIAIRDGVFSAKGLRAEVLKGSATIDFHVAPYREDPWYKGEVAVSEISIEELRKWLEPDGDVFDAGTFDLRFKGQGRDTLLSLVGTGHTSIDSDEPVAQNFPVIDGLIGFLETLVPTLRRRRSWTLDMPFMVDFGKIRTNNAALIGPSVTADISGFVDLHQNEVDIDVGVNLRGIVGMTAGAVTSLFGSNLINIKGAGPVDSIEWGLRGQARREARRQGPRLPRSLKR